MTYTSPLLYYPFNPNPLSIPHPTLFSICGAELWLISRKPTIAITGFWWIVSLINLKPYNPAHTLLWLIMLCVINALGFDLASCWISLAPASLPPPSLFALGGVWVCHLCQGWASGHEWCWRVWTVCTHHLGFIAQPCHFLSSLSCITWYLSMPPDIKWGV